MASSFHPHPSLPPDPDTQLRDMARKDEALGVPVHSFDPDASPQQKAAIAGKSHLQPHENDSPGGKEVSVGGSQIVPTITVENVDQESSQELDPSPVIRPSLLPGTLNDHASGIPDWYKVGWRAVGGVDTHEPEGIEKDLSILSTFLHEQYYGDWYHNAALIIFAVFSSHFLTRFNFGWGWLIIVLAFCNTYYVTSITRVRRRARDDIQRELVKSVKTGLDPERESAEWLNHFLERFWRIYEPVLSAAIVSSVDQILSTNCPPFLESLRLSTFTLGNKSFRVNNVRTFGQTDEETVLMNWSISFDPNDISDITPIQARQRVNPKIVLSIRLGKSFATAALPVLVEDLSFHGNMRVQMKLIANFPHIQHVELSFLEKPTFDFSLKPIGGETFGVDVANIPGLSSFIHEMVHASLSPMMYHPNVFMLNLEQILSGTPLDTAIGVLQVFVHSARGIKGAKLGGGSPDPYVSLSINQRRELARTKYKHNTYNPSWAETKFLLVNSLTESLILTLHDYNEHRNNTLLGAATFDLSALQTDTSHEGLSLPILKDGKDHGEMRFDVTYYPVLTPKVGEELPKTNVGIVRLVIHQAKDLSSTKSTSGNLNPFVEVLLGNPTTVIHTSKAVKHTKNPVWESATEFLCADRSTSIITIKVMDSVILGYMSVRLEDLLQSKAEMGKDWWPLSGCTAGKIRLSTEWRPLDMPGSVHGIDYPPIGVVRLWLQSATDVKNVEASLGGKSDPYVRVQINNITSGRTEVINNNLNPVWDQIIYVPVHSLKEILFLECMDYQHLTKDRSLGSVELHMSDLATQSDAVDYPFTSTGKKIVAEPLRLDKSNTFKGQLHYEAVFLPAVALENVEFEMGENRLQSAISDGGSSDSGGDPGDDGSSISSADADNRAIPSGITATSPLGENKKEQQNAKPTNTVSNGNAGKSNGVLSADEGHLQSPTSATSPRNLDQERRTGIDLSKEELLQRQSGIIAFRVISGQLSKKGRLEVLLDDGYWPAFVTSMATTVHVEWNCIGEGFIKELDFGRVWLRLNTDSGDKEDIIGEWKEDAKKFLEQALDGPITRTLTSLYDGRQVATVSLEARYFPVSVTLEPRESINNQGTLRVRLLDGRDIAGADRSGKSDPFAVFTLNGQRVFKSQIKKQTLTPEWNEDFTFSVPSRVAAKFEIELFDWNQIEQAKSLGTGQIDLASLEPFQGSERTIPLFTEKHKEKGKIRLNLNFMPELIAKSRKNTSTFSAAGRAMTQIGTIPVGAGKGVLHGVAGVFKKSGRNGTESELIVPVPPQPSGQISRPVAIQDMSHNVPVSLSISPLPLQDVKEAEPGALKVSVVDVKGFNPTGDSVKPYIVLRCGDKEHKTKHASKSSSPDCCLNESFVFPASPSIQLKVYFWLFDYKTLGKDKQLGMGEIDIWHHIRPGEQNSVEVPVELAQGQGLLNVRLDYNASSHLLTRKASDSSMDGTSISPSHSRFSIRGRRPGAVNDD